MESTRKAQQSLLVSELRKEYAQKLNLGRLNSFGRSYSEEVETIGENAEVNNEESDGEQCVCTEAACQHGR